MDSRSTPTRRFGSATACSSRAATTSTSTPGSTSAPIAKDGFTIPLSNTQTVVQFYKVLSTFDSATRQSLDNILNNFNAGFSPNAGQPQSDSGAGGLKQAVPALTPVFKDTAIITRALTGTQNGDVGRLLRGSASVTSALASTSAQLASLVTGLDATSSALASSDGALAQSVSGTRQDAPDRAGFARRGRPSAAAAAQPRDRARPVAEARAADPRLDHECRPTARHDRSPGRAPSSC